MADQGLERLEAAYHRLLNDIRALTDPQDRVERASEIYEKLERMRSEIADIRIRSVGAIWEDEELSLSQLSERVGVSKARAGQMTQDYERRREGER